MSNDVSRILRCTSPVAAGILSGRGKHSHLDNENGIIGSSWDQLSFISKNMDTAAEFSSDLRGGASGPSFERGDLFDTEVIIDPHIAECSCSSS